MLLKLSFDGLIQSLISQHSNQELKATVLQLLKICSLAKGELVDSWTHGLHQTEEETSRA